MLIRRIIVIGNWQLWWIVKAFTISTWFQRWLNDWRPTNVCNRKNEPAIIEFDESLCFIAAYIVETFVNIISTHYWLYKVQHVQSSRAHFACWKTECWTQEPTQIYVEYEKNLFNAHKSLLEPGLWLTVSDEQKLNSWLFVIGWLRHMTWAHCWWSIIPGGGGPLKYTSYTKLT